MTRVSENSKNAIINNNLSRVKEKLENLSIKGSTFKKISKPSDDPVGNVNLLSIRSSLNDNQQFMRNLNYAKTRVDLNENAISNLSEIILRAKEIAIAQSSDTFNPEIRSSVAEEIDQLLKQALAIGNQKMGNRYLFSGYAAHQKPFDSRGMYHGDNGHTFIEIKKNFFVPVNLTGRDIFFDNGEIGAFGDDPVNERDLASALLGSSKEEGSGEGQKSLLDILGFMRDSLRENNVEGVRSIMDGLDKSFSHLNILRAQVGSLYSSIMSAEDGMSEENLIKMEYKSKIEDEDVIDLFSELEKQNSILQAAYKSGASLLNGGLLDFLGR